MPSKFRPIPTSIALAIACLASAPSIGRGGILTVGPGQTYATIAGAYAAAVNDDTILIHDGTYAGGLVVGKRLTFQAVNVGGAIVSGGGMGPDDAVFRVAADSSYIGLTLTGASNGLYQRDSGAFGLAERLIITDCGTAVGINNSGGTAGSFDVSHLTIFDCATGVGINDGGTINIFNSIIANVNTAYVAHANIAINPSHNLLFNVLNVSASTGSGNIGIDLAQLIGDPLFASVAGSDFRLSVGSPAIDTGADLGRPFEGGAPDRGAFEFQEIRAVPEPSSLVMFGFATASLLACLARRRV